MSCLCTALLLKSGSSIALYDLDEIMVLEKLNRCRSSQRDIVAQFLVITEASRSWGTGFVMCSCRRSFFAFGVE
ncbi:hypothetical protein A9K65_030140 [Mesorhizobium sp. WSM1497]|nr:hypothetical protein A9K65_030140 [Mesorhizobium sp. WSM1497]PBC13859.1 hypothetical protein CK225_25080 [Mesorhizobium loti]